MEKTHAEIRKCVNDVHERNLSGKDEDEFIQQEIYSCNIGSKMRII